MPSRRPSQVHQSSPPHEPPHVRTIEKLASRRRHQHGYKERSRGVVRRGPASAPDTGTRWGTRYVHTYTIHKPPVGRRDARKHPARAATNHRRRRRQATNQKPTLITGHQSEPALAWQAERDPRDAI